ncbi:hypothetical protein REPUB_Repub09cG0042200 [Reevesia pubescens]
MGRGLATFLFRISTSKNNVSRVKFMLSNPYFHSFRQFENWVLDEDPFVPSFNVPRREFSTSLVGLVGKFRNYGDANVRPFSSVVENGDDDDGGGEDSVMRGSRRKRSKEGKYIGDFVRSIDFDCVNENKGEDGVDGFNENGLYVSRDVGTEHESDKDNEDIVDFMRTNGFDVVRENSDEDGVDDFNEIDMCDATVVESEYESKDLGNDRTGGGKQVAFCDPVELYHELRNTENRAKLKRADWEIVLEVFNYFSKSGWAANQSLAIYIGRSFFPTAVHKFRSFFFKKCSSAVAEHVISLGPSDAAVKFLFPIFVEFCIEEFPMRSSSFEA